MEVNNIVVCGECYEENEVTRKTCEFCGAKLYNNLKESKDGKQIFESKVTKQENKKETIRNTKIQEVTMKVENLEASTSLKVLCFLIPLVGLLIYSNNISFNKKFATECGKSSLKALYVWFCIIAIGILIMLSNA